MYEYICIYIYTYTGLLRHFHHYRSFLKLAAEAEGALKYLELALGFVVGICPFGAVFEQAEPRFGLLLKFEKADVPKPV